MGSVKLTLHSGDLAHYTVLLDEHIKLKSWYEESASSYGLPSSLPELDDVGLEMLEAIYPASENTPSPLPIAPPPSLALPPLLITLSSSPGLKKTVQNFSALCSTPPKFKSKRSPFPDLSYLSPMGSKVFRIEEDFVAQVGDVTRGDGSGGESIYGGAFNDEKEGLKVPFELGTVAMASGSSKNSNTSQFFITLASTPSQLQKLTGKYIAFGLIDALVPSHRETLERLSKLANGKGGTQKPVWIGSIEVLE